VHHFTSRTPRPAIPRLGDVEALEGLASHRGNDLEVLVKVQDGQPGEFGSGGDDQIGYRWCPVLAAVGQQGQDLDSAVLDGRCLGRAEYPTSSRVTVVIRTSPRSIRAAHCAASGLAVSRTRADLSISQSVTAMPAT
jgi:hypothetical protein